MLMPFVVKNELPTYQEILNQTFKEYLNYFMKIFLDDFIVYNDVDTHTPIQIQVIFSQMQGIWYQLKP
jgi:hypothetical protein